MKRSGRSQGKEAMVKTMARFSLLALFFVILTLGKIIRSRHLDTSSPALARDKKYPRPRKSKLSSEIADHHINTLSQTAQKLQTTIQHFPLNCSNEEQSQTCSANNYYPSSSSDQNDNQAASCPDYFRWIHDDLWPWRETGISEEMVMRGRPKAHFRLVVVEGKAYVETYKRPYQTRDILTQWGILQMLRRYPGKLPDLDLMFDCGDEPLINSTRLTESPAPPPLFAYCGNDSTLDIVFPDWSFWGWHELNIKPWELELKEVEEVIKKSEWKEREAYAYWKGNPAVAEARKDLLTCNVSDKHDWNARIYYQDWYTERKQGFKNSGLANQCMHHRYKIYVEGVSWSVSLKYIMACDSTALLIKPKYYDFFTRGLVPLKHYWPVKDDGKCRSIKHAVDWGNNHPQEAEAIGEAGSNFIRKQANMDYVYDYMFHLLNAYAKLLTYKPTVPKNAVPICPEYFACSTKGLMRKNMMDTHVEAPLSSEPCSMPPPYDPASLRSVVQTKHARIKQVDTWEKHYWQATTQ